MNPNYFFVVKIVFPGDVVINRNTHLSCDLGLHFENKYFSLGNCLWLVEILLRLILIKKDVPDLKGL